MPAPTLSQSHVISSLGTASTAPEMHRQELSCSRTCITDGAKATVHWLRMPARICIAGARSHDFARAHLRGPGRPRDRWYQHCHRDRDVNTYLTKPFRLPRPLARPSVHVQQKEI